MLAFLSNTLLKLKLTLTEIRSLMSAVIKPTSDSERHREREREREREIYDDLSGTLTIACW